MIIGIKKARIQHPGLIS